MLGSKLASGPCSPRWVPASLSGFPFLPARGCTQDNVFNTLPGIMLSAGGLAGPRSAVFLETAVQVPILRPKLFTTPSQRSPRAPPLCALLWADLQCSFVPLSCDFTSDFPSTHFSFPLGELLFIPQDPNPAPLSSEAFLAPHLLTPSSHGAICVPLSCA